ncbi:MAG: PAS sensor histidine kinase [uncultured archaeon A07HB70]|nr:MAG: PAS sensor histidine kinase [uncultured archaeon A07HB70]
MLHVDDDPEFADLTGAFLERENGRFTVETSTSADGGLERIDTGRYDCIVSDYNMPGTDGLEFLQAVRDEYPDLPFVLFTGKGSEAVASGAIAAGVTDYLQKESGTEQYTLLANRIENAVRARREAKRASRTDELMRLTEFVGGTGGFELDVDTGDVTMTDGARRILNVPEQANPDFEDGLQYYHPDDREELRQTITRALQTGEQTSGTFRYQHPDGEAQLLDMTYTPVSADGDATVVRGAINDVTERREAEAAVDWHQAVIEHVPAGVYVLDAGYELRFADYRVDGLEGLSEQNWADRQLSYLAETDILSPGELERVREAVDRLVAGETDEVTVEVEPGRPASTDVAELGLRPLDAGTDEDLVLVTTRDVTEHKRREREILELKRQYETLVENLPNGAVFLFDTDCRYVRARGTELEAVGIPPDEIEGSTPHDLFPEETADELARYVTDALDGSGHTFTQTLGDETYRNRVVPVKTGADEITHAMALTQNVTDQTEHRAKLERQNRRLEEFTSIVSHDLRNPLTVAEGSLELAQETGESSHLSRAADAVGRSQTLVDDLLTLAREGEAVAEVGPVVLADVAEQSWRTAETPGATLDVDATQTIRADRSRLQQLFENLYRNAAEHSSGEVTVSVGATDGGFYVADTGPGIPESDREEVFEAGHSTVEEGTGFGLRIVEQIADAHGWAVGVTESERGGARFEFTGVGFADR